jgi:hypothetical protein
VPLVVSSAAGANGDGYGQLLAFDRDGKALGVFCGDTRISDPRGMAVDPTGGLLFVNCTDRILAISPRGQVVRDSGQIQGLNPGGGNFGPDGRYLVTARTEGTILAFPASLTESGQYLVSRGTVPFPRGFAFGRDRRLFLASGIGPHGEGDNTILTFSAGQTSGASVLVRDPELSPLDLTLAPNGNILVASEHPFGAPDATTTVREYGPHDGRLVRVLSPQGRAEFRKPRGLRVGPSGDLCCCARDEIVRFDLRSGECLGIMVRLPRLNAQALAFLASNGP